MTSMKPFIVSAMHHRAFSITLTKRNNASPTASELVGFPHHALDTYLHKLVKAGFRLLFVELNQYPK